MIGRAALSIGERQSLTDLTYLIAEVTLAVTIVGAGGAIRQWQGLALAKNRVGLNTGAELRNTLRAHGAIDTISSLGATQLSTAISSEVTGARSWTLLIARTEAIGRIGIRVRVGDLVNVANLAISRFTLR